VKHLRTAADELAKVEGRQAEPEGRDAENHERMCRAFEGLEDWFMSGSTPRA